MIEEKFEGYKIVAVPHKTGGKWAVGAKISRVVDGTTKEKAFLAEDNIHYILEIEAAKEGINLGKNLIKNSLVGF
jgi:hypothetical protein